MGSSDDHDDNDDDDCRDENEGFRGHFHFSNRSSDQDAFLRKRGRLQILNPKPRTPYPARHCQTPTCFHRSQNHGSSLDSKLGILLGSLFIRVPYYFGSPIQGPESREDCPEEGDKHGPPRNPKRRLGPRDPSGIPQSFTKRQLMAKSDVVKGQKATGLKV